MTRNTPPSTRDTAKSSRLRRTGGYRWEHTLTDRINCIPHWKAFRLGAPTLHLPDIVAVCMVPDVICAVECKSTREGNHVYVPGDQIERCVQWVTSFAAYNKRVVLLAAYFGGTSKGKKPVQHILAYPYSGIYTEMPFPDVRISREGKTFVQGSEGWESFKLKRWGLWE